MSPDRLVVVYRGALAPDDPVRLNARRQIGGRLLQADYAVARDVIRVPGGDAEAVATRSRGLAGVEDVYADRAVSASLDVNDRYFRSQWGLSTMQAPIAWDTSQGQGVRVAVLDCGVHGSHPDLMGKVVLEQNFTASATADDRCNHGTHVAGIVAARTNNSMGVAGVAPAATIVSGKVLGDSGSGFISDVDRSIQWAAENGARVINMSFGSASSCLSGTQLAVDQAWSRGVVLIAAAGNSGASQAVMPANCRNVIGVAATDVKDVRPSWSNYGTEVDVAAPGVSIISTINPELNSGDEYRAMSGTSMAAPHAAGVAALIWSTSYGSAPAAVRDRLFAAADRINGTSVYWTYGRINAANAVAGGGSAATTPASPTGLVAKAWPAFNRLEWMASSTANVTYNVYRGTVVGGTKQLIASGLADTRYEDRSTLDTGQTYCYAVAARGGTGESAPSAEACVVGR